MMKRDACLQVLARHRTDEIVVAVYQAAQEWLHISPSDLNYTFTGAMGQGSSHALGIALGRPDRRVVVLDGDGSLLTRIIHQPEKSTREGPFGGQMILNTTVCQDQHDPKASSSDGLNSVRIGLSVASRRTPSWQPPRADNHRFAFEPRDVSIALTGPTTSALHTLTTLNSASIPAPPGTTRAMQSGSVPCTLARGHRV
jgi:Thiamine pyrophosphate enzyme, C-terminal TPP binding domain